MVIEREIEIARAVEDVFAFVEDARNDVRWCPKVRSVEPVGEGRWTVVHRPIPLRPERRLDLRRVAAQRPARIELLEDDGIDVFRVSYDLSATPDGGTRFRQRSEAQLGTPRIFRPIVRAGIGRDLERQLRELKRVLES